MYRLKFVFSMVMTVVLSGCASQYSGVPTAVNFETSKQRVLQAAHHWDLINEEVSKTLAESLAGKVKKNERILIKPENSLYSEQLYYDLVKHLTVKGYTVVKYDFKKNSQSRQYVQHEKNIPSYDVSVDLKTEVIKFSRGRKQASNIGYPTSIVSGLWFLKVIDATAYGAATVGATAYDVYDWFDDEKYANALPRTEVIIDMLASRSDEYVAVSKGIFYVVESDAEMYKAAKNHEPHMREFNTVGTR